MNHATDPSAGNHSLFLKATKASVIWAKVSAGKLTSVAAVSFRSDDRNIIGRLNRQSALHVALERCCAEEHAKAVSIAGPLAKGKRGVWTSAIWHFTMEHVYSSQVGAGRGGGLSTVVEILAPTAPGSLASPMWK